MCKQELNTITDIASLIPQRTPIMMLDSFCCIDDKSCSSSLTLQENIFMKEDGTIAQEGLLEHIAQSAAAWIGYRRIQAGKSVALGFIGDIRKCTYLASMPKKGDVLQTHINIVSDFGEIIMISATTMVNNQEIVTCSMKLASEN